MSGGIEFTPDDSIDALELDVRVVSITWTDDGNYPKVDWNTTTYEAEAMCRAAALWFQRMNAFPDPDPDEDDE